MRSFWSLSLQRQLAIAVGLLLVPVVSAAIWSGMNTYRERATELGDQTRLVAYTTAASINRDLTYLDGTAANLVANPDIRVIKPSASVELLRRIAGSLDDHVHRTRPPLRRGRCSRSSLQRWRGAERSRHR